MSNEQPAGPVDHLISVTCDLASSTITLGYSTVYIKPGDRVAWEFFGLPTGWSPWIEFRSETAVVSFLGPFTGLTQSSASLWGWCRNDPDLVGKDFTYRISIQKGVGAGWTSGTTVINSSAALLTIRSVDSGTGHKFTVSPSDEGPLALSVSPAGVIIQPGDTIEWIFEGIQGDVSAWRPIVDFVHYDGKGAVPNDYLGPFTGLETAVARVRGMGNTRVDGIYHFQVSVVKVGTGEILWISSGDPVIDNRGGSPIEPPSTGGG